MGLRLHQSIGRVTRHEISSLDARATTPRRSGRDPRRAIRGLQGAAQGNHRGCAGEAAGGYPIPSTRRSAQPTATVQQWADAVQTLADLLDRFEAGQIAVRPREQRDGGSARCRVGAARSCRRSSGRRVAKRLWTGLTAARQGMLRATLGFQVAKRGLCHQHWVSLCSCRSLP